MLTMRKDRWAGNQWASIDIMPNDDTYFLPILSHLSHLYAFPFPHITDLIDGYAADFQIDGTYVTIDMDTYMFSIAFADETVRDRVFADLQALPADYFDQRGQIAE
jgi:hypothetical protein